MSKKRTIIGKFIHSSWTNLNIRCGKYKHLQTKSKCASYEEIKIEFTRDKYKEWCYNHKDLIENLIRPSLDRIDKTKNYSIDNIQLIELVDNIAKDKLKFTETTGICFKCKEVKNIEEFVRDKRRLKTGRTTICKPCERKRK